MPRYYFHIRQGDELIRDEEGTDLTDVDEAKCEARASARDILIDEIRAGREPNGRQVEVMDTTGNTVAIVPLRELLFGRAP